MALTNDKLKRIRPTADVAPYGAVETTGAVTSVEKGDDINHISILTVTNLTVVTPAGAANLAGGALVYTFPAGRVMIDKVYISIDLTTSGSTVTNDTPDLGIGTTVGSGAVAVLGGTAAFENILTGQTVNDVDGTDEVATAASTLTIETADDHTVYLNCADGWAGAEATGVQANGTIILVWKAL